MFNLSRLAILFSVGTSLLLSSSATGQLIPDRTLGRESSTVQRNVNIRGINSARIDGGARRGRNLFHSFQKFNVSRGRGVYFSNPAGVKNILTRVTGRNRSNILGRLGVLGGANLYLINPNGILFGRNASLDLRGSFYATTADGIKLGENGSFNASDPYSSNLLTVDPGALFQNAMRNYLARIENQGNLSARGNLFLSADQLNLQGQLMAGENLILQARDTLTIRDSKSQPFIATARENLSVEGQGKLDIFTLNHPSSGLFSGRDMVLRSSNTIVGDSYYWSGGNFSIEQLDKSSGNWSSIKDPIIRSFGDVSFNNYTGASLQILAGGSVNVPGIIAIVSPDPLSSVPTQVTLSDGTVVSVDGSTRPTVDIRAGVSLNQRDLSLPISNNLFPQIIARSRPTSADINIGGIVMLGENAANGEVLLTNQYQPNLSLPGGDIKVGVIITSDRFSEILNQPQFSNIFQLPPGVNPDFNGNGGDVIIDSRNSIRSLHSPVLGEEFSLINTTSASGNSGDLTLIAKGQIALNNSFLFSDTFGRGQSGNITIKASSVDLDNTIVSSNIGENATGNGGNITIETENLRLAGKPRSLISAINAGTGQGGDINISATNSLELIGPGLESFEQILVAAFTAPQLSESDAVALVNSINGITTISSAAGDGGNIKIDSRNLIARNGGLIATATLARGEGGALRLNATDRIEVIDTGLFSSTFTSGNARDLKINTGKLIVRNRAGIITTTRGDGNAGNLIINATDSVELSSSVLDDGISRGLFSSTIGGTGNGGKINITTGNLSVRDGMQINAISGTINPAFKRPVNIGGEPGNITINARESVTVSGTSKVSSSNGLLPRPSIITSDTLSPSRGGNINITTKKFIVDEGQISTATFFTGNAGKLNIVAEEIDLRGTDIQFQPNFRPGSGLFASAQETATGAGGSIILDSKRIIIRDDGRIAVNSQGSGIGGNIDLTADSLTLDRFGSISAETNSDRGGNITLDLNDRLVLQDNSTISITAGLAGGAGDGGNLNINSPLILAFPNNNEITANAFAGMGGNINITTNAILGYPQYLNITASSQRGIDGTVTFNNLVTNLDSGVVEAPITPIDATALVSQDACEAIASDSNFVVKGKGGLPPQPTDLLESQRPLVEWTERLNDARDGRVSQVSSEEEKTMPSTSQSNFDSPTIVTVRPRREDAPLVIQQARGWIKKPDGTIVLTAYQTEGKIGNPRSLTHRNCSSRSREERF